MRFLPVSGLVYGLRGASECENTTPHCRWTVGCLLSMARREGCGWFYLEAGLVENG